jgi:excisionase family DNA binding protein
MKSDVFKTDAMERIGTVPQKDPPAFLTYKEFAYESRLSPSSVRKRVRQGELRATRIGRAVRIPRSELERLVRLSELQTAGRGED